mmetsp:Transcript_21232/g.49423  ORF Transcript_21232/g.49423 Transcript_21232/m.49423 type:complete len:385 (-) Transcript_21232:113-1267(-)
MSKFVRCLLAGGHWLPLAALLLFSRAAAFEEREVASLAPSALTSQGGDSAVSGESSKGGGGAFLEPVDPPPSPSLTFRCHQLVLCGSWLLLVGFLLVMAALISVYVTASLPELKYILPTAVDALREFPISCHLAIGAVTSLPALVFLVLMHYGLRGRLEFLHIPKNGGTAVELAGIQGGIRWSAESVGFTGIQHMPDGSSCARYHVPPRLYRGGMYTHAHVFCVVRHPFERAVSEYQYLLNDDLQALTATSWGWQYYKMYNNGLYDYTPCTSQGLNHFVQRTLSMYNEGNKYIDDCHHVSQSEFIWDDAGHRQCDSILRLENLAQEFNQLMSKHGYEVRINPNPYYSSAELCPNISVDSLTDKSRQMLREVYADDFRLLGFDPF